MYFVLSRLLTQICAKYSKRAANAAGQTDAHRMRTAQRKHKGRLNYAKNPTKLSKRTIT